MIDEKNYYYKYAEAEYIYIYNRWGIIWIIGKIWDIDSASTRWIDLLLARFYELPSSRGCFFFSFRPSKLMECRNNESERKKWAKAIWDDWRTHAYNVKTIDLAHTIFYSARKADWNRSRKIGRLASFAIHNSTLAIM